MNPESKLDACIRRCDEEEFGYASFPEEARAELDRYKEIERLARLVCFGENTAANIHDLKEYLK